MYKVIYADHRAPIYHSNLTDLTNDLKNDFSDRIVNDVKTVLQSDDRYNSRYFDIEYYVGYIYNGDSFTTLWTLAQALVEELNRDTKIERFIQNVGICARMDNGDEVDLPWYDMINNDYDHKEYDESLSSEVDYYTAKEINKALEELVPESGSFVFSFWESSFDIEVEEED